MILNLLTLFLIAADNPDVEIKTVTKTIEKINAKADFTIIDAHASDLLKLVSARTIEVDISEVANVIKKRDLRVTLKSIRWIDIITNIADQIHADILIGPENIKLVPRKDLIPK